MIVFSVLRYISLNAFPLSVLVILTYKIMPQITEIYDYKNRISTSDKTTRKTPFQGIRLQNFAMNHVAAFFVLHSSNLLFIPCTFHNRGLPCENV